MPVISYREEIKRKLIHLSSLWMPLVMCFLPKWPLCAMFAVLFLLSMAVEYARSCRVPVVTPVYDFFFGRMLREEPKRGSLIISGGPPVYAAAALVLLLFCKPAAPVAMTVMLLGDSMAALVGRRFGKHKSFNGKSWEGTAAFVIAGLIGACLILLICESDLRLMLWALPAVVFAAAAELFTKQLKLDDNFTIPVIVGLLMSLPEWLA